MIYTIQSDGGFNWNGTYGANITSYEEKLNFDINNAGALGLILPTLEAISTDTEGVTLKRGNGELYLIDGDNTIQITEEHGGSPQLERSDSWQGGSFSSTAYAAVKNSDDTYSVAIKFEESFSDDFFHKEGNNQENSTSEDSTTSTAMTAWEINSISSSGVINWENSAFTTDISGYEKVFNLDMNGDIAIGINTTNLNAVTTDTVGDQLKVSTGGSIYIWDGVDEDNLITVKESSGGTPTFSVNHDWGEGSYVMAPYAVTKIDANKPSEHYRVLVKHTDTYSWDGEIFTNENWELFKVSTTGIIDWESNIWTDSIISWEDDFGMDINGDKDFSGTVAITDRATDITAITDYVVYSLFISTYFLERSHPQAVPCDSPEFRLIIIFTISSTKYLPFILDLI